ncbi:sulfate ABC transporter, ATPase subunit [Rhodomicrobium vannielii ATCC 17100]|jgi:sulfate/thiosulfate transport system ATP-binding protein|uniref:Sulfate ABC transporter, ATPase subunit n=1 Tax=Rhodomicrobium vannielii (strain ATCC 17100 / DSM 162 / LMG 4299 / NCIMB 10020 / ATH 3.1.1) TaxID=648757 RepID=E3I623_RHOVT|nr:sulfate ABC transporter ATP-binding protein [Rhodomicrobium vannielii]ADP70616.1 sulfate ABC transporter, ATPase subunit [Rhodomicrobium vannielii ATCC 17100]
MKIDVRNLSKRFGNFVALKNVDLDIASGELLALLGPSGSGKTTLLRIIAGLDFADGGEVYFAGENAANLNVRKRHVGFVFQHYALFRHMTVFENVAFGLRVRPRRERKPEHEIVKRVKRLLEFVHIEGLAERYPDQLSGGQRQRVALARALAIEPNVLLLDEPFGALDAKVRKSLRRWLRDLHGELNVTSVLVTHDQEEALEVADRIVVMGNGKIEQVGTPEEIYNEPANSFVFDFIGESVKLPVRIENGGIWIGSRRLATNDELPASGPARLFVRPHDLTFGEVSEAPLQGAVRSVRRVGALSFADVRLDYGGDDLLVEASLPPETIVRAGDLVGLTPRRYRIYEDGAAESLTSAAL